MAFHIKPFRPEQNYGYAHHQDIRAYLGLYRWRNSFSGYTAGPLRYIQPLKMPEDFAKVVVVPLTDGRTTELYACHSRKHKHGGKSSRHRCFVTCPDCGKGVPAGRAHQHKCK